MHGLQRPCLMQESHIDRSPELHKIRESTTIRHCTHLYENDLGDCLSIEYIIRKIPLY